jgi:hypothetical protein
MEAQAVKTLVEKWENMPGKMSIKDIQDIHVKEQMAILLENQETKNLRKEFLGESAGSINTTVSQTAAGLDGAFSPIALALVRRTFPELFANSIVGVQAMTGPVGLAYALRVIYKGTSNEAGFDVVPEYSGFTGSTRATSGTADAGTGVSTTAAEAWEIAGTTATPELTLKIDKVAIEAKTRKLAASYSLESAQDIQAMHGIDIDREMVNYLQYEVQAEIDREVLAAVKTAAYTGTALDVSAVDGRWSQERLAILVNKILKESNNIGTRTRRGVGNFVVVSPDVATALQSVVNGTFTANKSAIDASNVFANIGTINGSIKVFRDTYNTSNQVVVGFKGPQPSDAGIIFSPYIMGLFNRAIDDASFSPRIGCMSRYAITSSLLGASRYYTKFSVSNLTTALPA